MKTVRWIRNPKLTLSLPCFVNCCCYVQRFPRRHTLSFCFNPKQFAVFCFHRGLTFCQPGSWLLICHWRNLGHDFYFLLGVWSVCVCSKSFRPEELIKATASSRVEAVCDSIQGSQENPLAPHSSKLCCTALGARVVASCPKWHVVGRWQ